MEDKKRNELSDEALDAVTGGAFYRLNTETGKYDVISCDKKYIATYDTEADARKAAWEYTKTEPLPGFRIVDLSGQYRINS